MVTPALSASPSRLSASPVAIAAMILALVVGIAGRAEARPITDADTALRARALVHAAAIGALLAGHPGEPMRALDDVDGYRRDHDKEMREILRQLYVVRAELDEPLRADWDAGLKGSSEGMRVVAAVLTLRFKYRDDAAVTARLETLTGELKQMLEDARVAADKPAKPDKPAKRRKSGKSDAAAKAK
jgi:hypothetical protein